MMPQPTDRYQWTLTMRVREVLTLLTATLARYAQQVEQERLALETLSPQLEKQARSKGITAQKAKQQLRAVRTWARTAEDQSKHLLGWKRFLEYADPEQLLNVNYSDYEFFALTSCQPLANWVQTMNEDEEYVYEDEEEDPF